MKKIRFGQSISTLAALILLAVFVRHYQVLTVR